MKVPGGRRLTPRKKKQVFKTPDIPAWRSLTTPAPHNPTATGGVAAPPVGIHPTEVLPQHPPGGASKPGVGLSPIEQAHQIAMSQLQPELDQYDSQSREEQSAHDARTGQLTGWTKWYQDQLNSAFGDTENALNKLISSSATSEQGAQDSLAAALRGGATGQSDLARIVGGSGPQGSEADILTSALNRRVSGDQATRDLATAEMGAQGQRRSLAGTQLLNLADTERRRSAATMKEITTGRKGVLARLPGLEQVALKDQRDFELAKSQLGEQHASRLFQQWLSEKELNLKTKDQSFQQYLANQQLGLSQQEFGLKQQQFLHDKKIDWANIGVQRDQIQAQLAGITQDMKSAKTKQQRENAKLRGQAIANGVTALSAYMSPRAGEAQPGVEGGTGLQDPSHQVTDPATGAKVPGSLQRYRRTYDGAMRVLIQAGVPRSDALRILKNSEFASWRNRAGQEWNRLKRRGGGAQGYSKSKNSQRPD